MSCFFRWNLITVDRTFWGPSLKLTFARWTSTKSSRTIHTYTHTLCKYGCIGLHTGMQYMQNSRYNPGIQMGKSSQVYTCEPTFSRGVHCFNILFFKQTPGSLKVCHSKWPSIYSWFIYEKVGGFSSSLFVCLPEATWDMGILVEKYSYFWDGLKLKLLKTTIYGYLGWDDSYFWDGLKLLKTTLKSFRCHRQGLSTVGWLWERNGLQRLFQAAIIWTALHFCQT